MAAIEVDFDVFKELTARRPSEDVTHNDVLRELLKLRPVRHDAPPDRAIELGCTFKGVHFPEGTQFRASYKGKVHTAAVRRSQWVDSEGIPRNSPSEAASGVTGNNVNGWTFWEAKRPGDTRWRKLEALR